jgi:hypothetical protein
MIQKIYNVVSGLVLGVCLSIFILIALSYENHLEDIRNLYYEQTKLDYKTLVNVNHSSCIIKSRIYQNRTAKSIITVCQQVKDEAITKYFEEN